MITQQITELPFDINTYRVHSYTPTGDGLHSLSDYLAFTILDALASNRRSTNPVWDFAPIRHADIILNLAHVLKLESIVTAEVWIIEPSLDTDLKIFGEIIKNNLSNRAIRYRYLLPQGRDVARQWERFVHELGYRDENGRSLAVRTVEPHVIESEVVIYDPYTGHEDVLIMSPREQEFVFWYRVGTTRGESIRDRFETLWEGASKPLAEPSG
jgi:hypothetical protein